SGTPLGTIGTADNNRDPLISPDGTRVVYDRFDGEANTVQLWFIDLRRLVTSKFSADSTYAAMPAWSPDGTRLAFSGTGPQGGGIYVRATTGSAGAERVATRGGLNQVTQWSADGRDLFYVSGDRRLTAVPIGGGSALEAGRPQPLFEIRPASEFNLLRNAYDVSADGQRFLVLTLIQDPDALRIAVVSQWQGAR